MSLPAFLGYTAAGAGLWTAPFISTASHGTKDTR